VFTLGGTNSSLYTGDIDFLPAADMSSGFWMLTLTSLDLSFAFFCLLIFFAALTVNGMSIPITGGQSALSVIDTGTTLMSRVVFGL
jgi:cathepsin D